MQFEIPDPSVILIVGLAVWAFIVIAYVWGYKKRPGAALSTVGINARRQAQLVRVFCALAIAALLLGALVVGAGATFVERKTGVIAYACDESRSMGAEDSIGVARIERCKTALLELDVFPHANVAVYGFTDGAASHSSFSLNHGYFRETVRRLVAIEAVPGSGSDIGASILYIVEDVVEKRDELGKESAVVVIGSDWENIGKREELVRALELANRHNVTLVPLAIAGTTPVTIPVYEDGELIGYEKKNSIGVLFETALDEETLHFVAERSGSIVIREDELPQARAFIESNLATEKIELTGVSSRGATALLLVSLLVLVPLIKYSILKPLL